MTINSVTMMNNSAASQAGRQVHNATRSVTETTLPVQKDHVLEAKPTQVQTQGEGITHNKIGGIDTYA